jgi:glycerol-3-phosphate acyltransferase PlsY
MAQARGVDIRKVGSGNIGATNVFRILGKTAGITVLIIDALKGFLPVFLLPFFFRFPTEENAQYYAMLAGFFAIIGHNYTCWLRFKGGKGIATSAGVLIALVPKGFLVALAVWLVVFAATRYVSLASIVAALILPLGVWATGGSPSMIILTAILGALAIYKHKANIQRLIAGTENRIGQKRVEGSKPA